MPNAANCLAGGQINHEITGDCDSRIAHSDIITADASIAIRFKTDTSGTCKYKVKLTSSLSTLYIESGERTVNVGEC